MATPLRYNFAFMKRHRGLKRYYKNLYIQNDFDKITGLKFDNPFNWPLNLHLHFDWYRYGNNSFKRRAPHLDKLFRHFDLLAEKINETQSGNTLYAIILDYYSGSDAIFIDHKSSVNGNLTFKVEDLSVVSTLTNEALIEYLEKLTGYEKLYGQANEAFCFLFKKDSDSTFDNQ